MKLEFTISTILNAYLLGISGPNKIQNGDILKSQSKLFVLIALIMTFQNEKKTYCIDALWKTSEISEVSQVSIIFVKTILGSHLKRVLFDLQLTLDVWETQADCFIPHCDSRVWTFR